MQRIAKDLGYCETAFVTARADGDYDVRYFSPEVEVPFCGHATIATAVALADRDGAGTLVFHTAGRPGPDRDRRRARPRSRASSPTSRTARQACSTQALAALALDHTKSSTPSSRRGSPTPAPATSSSRPRTRERLADLDYDFDALKQLMLPHDLTTVDLVHREDATTFHARNPFPVGGVVEDPATGAAAAAFGAYLKAMTEHHAARSPSTRASTWAAPSLLTVEIAADRPRSASAVARWRCEREVVRLGSLSASIATPSAASFKAATSRSIASGTGCTPGAHGSRTSASTASACSANETSMTAAG